MKSDYKHYRDFQFQIKQIKIPGLAVRAGQRPKEGLDAAFIMRGSDAEICFQALKEQKAEIENECGECLSCGLRESRLKRFIAKTEKDK